jgi:predicted amidophosphoribosyltransferase
MTPGPFTELLRPPACLACGRQAAWPLCAACLPDEPSAPGPWRLAADPAVTLWSLGPYADGLRQAVLAGKLGGQAAALAVLGRRLGASLAAAGVGADLVTWIASGPARRQPRDHARILAVAVATVLGLPAVRLLAPAPGPDLGRARGARRALSRGFGAGANPGAAVASAPGTELSLGAVPGEPVAPGAGTQLGPGARGWARPPPRRPPQVVRALAGGRVLLVDDVATTGATLAGAASALLTAGARAVEAATVAAAAEAIGGSVLGPPV